MIEDALSDATDELGLETIDSDGDDEQPSLETAKSLFWQGASDGSLALLGGGAFVLAGVRSVARGRFRAIGQLALGGGLLKMGQYQRRDRERTVIDRAIDRGGRVKDGLAEDETGGKSISDEAHAASERDDLDRVSQTDEDDDAEFGTPRDGDSGAGIEFTDETDAEPRSKPEVDTEEDDPRRNTDGDRVEIDVSDSALADEPGEATGPDPEQAQPSQTEGTEPEADVEEDASHMQADTPDGSDSASDDASGNEDGDESEIEGGDEDESETEDENEQ